MIESKSQQKRKVRDAKILELYELYKVKEGSLRTVAIEIIANELEVSASTVARITKSI
jgi:DNA-directed RNA polymerase specialized sigma54-like protein